MRGERETGMCKENIDETKAGRGDAKGMKRHKYKGEGKHSRNIWGQQHNAKREKERASMNAGESNVA